MQDPVPMDESSSSSGAPPGPNVPVKDTVMTDAVSDEDEARAAIHMLRGDNIENRVAAANRLESIAIALGPERTRDELLPFLTDGVDDEDEVLVAIATSLGKLVEHVGGSNHAHALLPPLELLLTVEETSVRDAASASTLVVANALDTNTFQGKYAELLFRLAEMEWFTARISAASLISHSYTSLDKQQQGRALELFGTMCRDDTPMVRRVASQNLGSMIQTTMEVEGRAALTPNGIVATKLIPLYEELAVNEQPDSVRLQTTENCVAFGRVMSQLAKSKPLEESEMALVKKMLPLIVATIDDRSWRVRWTAASKFSSVIEAYASLPEAVDSLVPAYEKLLQDPEAEVRTAATFNLAAVAKCQAMVLVNDNNNKTAAEDNSGRPRITVAERLVKCVTALTRDDSEHVRAALAMVATELAPVLGKDATISHLVPPVLLLLRDAASEVRLNLISSLSALNEVIGVDLLSQSLLPAILDLVQDGKWRIRLAIIQHIPLLAKQLGRTFFSDKLSSLCVGWLGDDISSVRQAAATSLKELTALFGTEWAREYLVPSIAEIRHHSSYLRRLTAVQACTLMSTETTAEMASIELLPMVLDMAYDTVPNIRFNVAKGLQTMAPVCGSGVFESQIRPVLVMLGDDLDQDVRYYAMKTLDALDEVFGKTG